MPEGEMFLIHHPHSTPPVYMTPLITVTFYNDSPLPPRAMICFAPAGCLLSTSSPCRAPVRHAGNRSPLDTLSLSFPSNLASMGTTTPTMPRARAHFADCSSAPSSMNGVAVEGGRGRTTLPSRLCGKGNSSIRHQLVITARLRAFSGVRDRVGSHRGRSPMSMAKRLAFSRLRNISSGGRVMLLSMLAPLFCLPPLAAMFLLQLCSVWSMIMRGRGCPHMERARVCVHRLLYVGDITVCPCWIIMFPACPTDTIICSIDLGYNRLRTPMIVSHFSGDDEICIPLHIGHSMGLSAVCVLGHMWPVLTQGKRE